ncbi:MAG: tetratricopeptide repeat protein [Pseudorhodobacter sp.]|nr:tetratricopeptide repeat protein [Pseudorhodobacter sp.]
MPNTEEWVPNVEQVGGDESQRMNYIRGLVSEGRTEEARAELHTLIEQDPKNTRALMAYGLSLMRDHRLADAVQYFEQAMEVDPKNAVAPILAAMVGVQGDNPEYAEANFHKALAIRPTSIQALTGLARLHQRNKKPDEAVAVLEHALEIDPQSERVRQRLAAVYSAMGRDPEAKAQLEYALSIKPGDQSTALLLARLCNKMDQPDEALKTLEAALAASPTDARLLLAVGRSKLAKKDFAGAEAAVRKAMAAPRGPAQAAPQFVQGGGQTQRPNLLTQIALVRALIPQKKLTEAREILGRAPRSGRARALVQRLYGDAFAVEGKFDAAEQSYHAALMQMRDGEAGLATINAAKATKPAPTGAALIKLYTDEFERRADAREENRGAIDREKLRERLRERRAQNGGGQGRIGALLSQRMAARAQQGGGGFQQGFAGRMQGGGGPALPPGDTTPAGGGGPANPRAGFLRALMARRRGGNNPQG